MNVLKRCQENVNRCVPFILMASYLYYIKDTSSPISDQEFDQICKLALENWKKIKHRHKRLIKQEDLVCGTLYRVKEKQYPLIVKCSAYQWLEHGLGAPNEIIPFRSKEGCTVTADCSRDSTPVGSCDVTHPDSILECDSPSSG